jgi:hypothetical protein
MKTKILCTLVCSLIAIISVLPSSAASDELIVKNCAELMRMAQNLQEDLKTTDLMMGAALQSGSMSTFKTYKLKKEATNKQLQSVLQAINLKGCSKTM